MTLVEFFVLNSVIIAMVPYHWGKSICVSIISAVLMDFVTQMVQYGKMVLLIVRVSLRWIEDELNFEYWKNNKYHIDFWVAFVFFNHFDLWAFQTDRPTSHHQLWYALWIWDHNFNVKNLYRHLQQGCQFSPKSTWKSNEFAKYAILSSI